MWVRDVEKNEARYLQSGFLDKLGAVCYAAFDNSCRKLSATCLATKTSGRIHAVGRAQSTTLSIFNTHLVYPAPIQRDFCCLGLYTQWIFAGKQLFTQTISVS